MPHILHTIWLDSHEPTNKDTLWIKPLKKDYYGIFVYGSNGWVLTTALFKGTIGEFVIDQLPEATPETNGVMSAQDKADLDHIKDSMSSIDELVDILNNIDEAPVEGSHNLVISGGIYEQLKSKVNAVPGKGLSTMDFTEADKQKLDNIPDDIVDGIQSDWNEADEASSAYVKNRTHWEENGVVHKLHPKFLDMDTAPTSGSTKPVTSGGVKEALNQALSGYVTSAALATALAGKVGSETIHNIVELTQAEYDALQTKSGDTMYITTDTTKVYIGSRLIKENVKANEEDIDFDSSDKLQFADRVYNSSTPDGLGYVILRKNKTFAQQVTAPNTIYEIRYPFTLSANFTIPSGCILRFDGGSISGAYTLTGNDTKIEATPDVIFNGVAIGGTWKTHVIYSTWFSNDAETIRQVFAMNSPGINTKVVIDGDYNVNISNSIGIDGNTDVYLSGTLKKTSNSVPNHTMLQITGSNVRFFGGVIDGNKSAFDTSSEYGHGIGVSGGAANVLVSGVLVKDCRGDGFYIGSTSSPAENLRISGCEINGARRNGISLIYAKSVEISDCKFYDINATDPGLAIDIEPNNAGQVNEHIHILRCGIDLSKRGIALNGTKEVIGDVLIKDCTINLDSYNYAMYWNRVSGLTIDSCDFKLKNRTSSYDFQISGSSAGDVKPRIVNCKIVSETASGYMFGNGWADIVNCTITSASSIFQYLYANLENCHVDCTAMFFEYGGATDYVKTISGCVLNIKGVTISGRSAAAPARNIVFENNIINSDATYYPVLSSYAKNITFRNNVMYLKGTRRCMDFSNADNITITNNRIKIGANFNVIQMNSPATNCQAKGNIFEVEDGVTFTAQHYVGINKSTSTSNKIGDPFYDESLGKMLMYNGTSVVNLDGTAL